MTDCGFPAAGVVVRHLPPGAPPRFVVAALEAPLALGVALCADHAHQALDYHLLSLLPRPSEAEKPEQR